MEESPFNSGNEIGASADLTLDGESFRKDLSRLLYRPQPRLDENIESSLSIIPWKLRLLQDETSSSATAPNDSGDSKEAKALSFPSASYLDLRRHQNLKFADDQCSKANPSAWKQALQLVPDHVPSLVGYGKFCLANAQLEQAEKLFEDALSIDPNHSLARRLLSELSEKRHEKNRHQPYTTTTRHANNFQTSTKPNLKTRESSAYQDALLERQLLASPKDDGSEQQQQQEEESLDRKHHKKSRRHHKRKKERKRRRKHYHDDSSASQGSESDDESRRRRKRKKRKREHSRREERRRHHRKQHHRRSKSGDSSS